MKFLFYADVHFREYGSFLPFNKSGCNGLTLELDNIIQGCKFVAEKIIELKPDAAWCLGDIFHNQETISVRTLYATHLGLLMIAEACEKFNIPHYAIPGQHDTYSEESGIYSISPLKSYFNRIIVAEDCIGFVASGIGPTQNLSLATCSVAVIPFISSHEKFHLNLMQWAEYADLIVTHHDFQGARYENEYLSKAPISPYVSIPIVSGDIHLPQKVGNVTYVGSLIQHRFSQHQLNENGVLLLDTVTGIYSRYFNNLSKHYVVIRDLEKIKMFNPNQVVLRVISPVPLEEIKSLLEGYDYQFIFETRESSKVKTIYTEISAENPVDILKAHVAKENPDALDMLNHVLKKEGKNNG